MKYSLSIKTAAQALKKADEIIVPYKDIDAMPDFAHRYPAASFLITNIPVEYDMNKIKKADKSCRNTVTFIIPPYKETIEDFKSFAYMFDKVATDMYMVTTMVENGASRVMVGGELLFAADKLAGVDIPLMICPLPDNFNNMIYDLQPKEFALQAFIRPEDLNLYDGENVYCHFIMGEKDSVYYRVYAEYKSWGGNLGILFRNNLGTKNPYLPPKFGTIRATCKHRCSYSRCRYCISAMNLAATVKVNKDYVEQQLDELS